MDLFPRMEAAAVPSGREDGPCPGGTAGAVRGGDGPHPGGTTVLSGADGGAHPRRTTSPGTEAVAVLSGTENGTCPRRRAGPVLDGRRSCPGQRTGPVPGGGQGTCSRRTTVPIREGQQGDPADLTTEEGGPCPGRRTRPVRRTDDRKRGGPGGAPLRALSVPRSVVRPYRRTVPPRGRFFIRANGRGYASGVGQTLRIAIRRWTTSVSGTG